MTAMKPSFHLLLTFLCILFSSLIFGCGKLTYSDSGLDAQLDGQADGPVVDTSPDVTVQVDLNKQDSRLDLNNQDSKPPDMMPNMLPDITLDTGIDGSPPPLGVVLVRGSIGTTASTGNSTVLLLDGTFESSEIVCNSTTCLIGGIEP